MTAEVASGAPLAPASAGPGELAQAQPVIKAAGGKRRIVPLLLAHLPPAGFGRYFEPFCGSAALYFALAPRAGSVLGDANSDLIEFYQALRDRPDGVCDALRALERDRERAGYVAGIALEEGDRQQARDEAERDHYYRTRNRWNDPECEWLPHERAAAFFYLNRLCFNGLWRVNRRGLFNVPAGRFATPPILCPEARLRAAAAALAPATLFAGDYLSVIAQASAGDLVYLDPPYDQAFVSYTRDGFNEEAQHVLAAEAEGLRARGVHVLLSNHDTELVRSMFGGAGWHATRFYAPRSISRKSDGRAPVAELLISSYRPEPAVIDVARQTLDAKAQDAMAKRAQRAPQPEPGPATLAGGTKAQGGKDGRWFVETLALPGIN